MPHNSSAGRVILMALIIGMFSSESRSQEASRPRISETTNALALHQVNELISLGLDPSQVEVMNINKLFRTDIIMRSCDKISWTCHWTGDLLNGLPSITNVFLPNAQRGKYKEGGTLMMELPADSCVSLENVAAKIMIEPIIDTVPPALLAYSPTDGDALIEAIKTFRNIPGMSNQVAVTTWMENGCLNRIQLEALIKKDD